MLSLTSLLTSLKAFVIASRVRSTSLSTSLAVIPTVGMGGRGVTIILPARNGQINNVIIDENRRRFYVDGMPINAKK